MKAKKPARKEINKALEIARTQLRDIVYGDSRNDLIEPLRVTIDRITEVLGDKFDIKSGEILDE